MDPSFYGEHNFYLHGIHHVKTTEAFRYVLQGSAIVSRNAVSVRSNMLLRVGCMCFGTA